MRDHVDFVSPTIRFARMRQPTLPAEPLQEYRREMEEAVRFSRPGNGSFINDPTFLRALYQLPDAYGKATDNVQCVCRCDFLPPPLPPPRPMTLVSLARQCCG